MQEQAENPSPETDHGHDRKRRRKVLSCTDCRRRKVQCDRNLPACGRCTKADKAASCFYEDEPPSASNGNTNGIQTLYASVASRQNCGQSSVTVSKDVWDDVLSRLLQQERTIAQLQNGTTGPTVNSLSKYETAHDGPAVKDSERDSAKEILLFRGKAFKTQFHGPTDARSSLTLIPEAFEYTRDIYMRSPTLVRYRRELRALRELKKSIARSEEDGASTDLLSYLPERDRTNVMVELYLDNVDQTFGILHVPSFRREYESFWVAPRSSQSEILVTILLMTACVECLFNNSLPLYVADSPLPRERASQVVKVCESWLIRQSQKHTTLAYFQNHCLLLIAKEMNGIKLKKRWVDSGNLLRLAVSSGLHRDTDLLQKQTSVFDKEMRKRIWSFIVEVDLQASLDRGVPAVSLDYPSDCGLPSNLNDDDLYDTITAIPPERPPTELTKMSYLRLSGESRSLRSRLTKLMNMSQPPLSYDDFLAYTQEIEQSLEKLPEWPSSNGTALRYSLSSYQGVALLRIQLEQFLLVMHAFAARTATVDVGTSFSKTVFLSTSRSIIRKLTDLTVTGRRFLLLYRQDIIQIFVSIGHLGTVSGKRPMLLDADLCRPWLELAEVALGLFEDRIMRSGNVQWTFSFAIYDLLNRQLPISSTPKDTMSGADRVYRLVKYILENQDPNFSMKAATHEVRPAVPTPLQNALGTNVEVGLPTPTAAHTKREPNAL